MTTTEDRIEQLEERPPLSPRQAALWAVGVAWYLVAAWLFVQRGLVDWLSNSPSLNFYLAQPIIWLGLAGFSYIGWRRLPDPPQFSRVLTAIATLLAALHVGFLVFGGIVFGFGDSYVAGQIANYPRNFWFIATWLLGLEMARAFILHAWRPYGERWAFAATTALLALAMTPYGQLVALDDGAAFFSTLGGFIFPAIILSILLTWLVDHGGPAPAIAYRFVLLAFEWFSQVQPDLEWPVLFVIGSVAPIVSARFIRSIYLDTEEGQTRWANLDDSDDEDDEYEPRRGFGWSLATTVSLIALLMLGAGFGYRPAVVSGISMEPAYERGDMAIIKRDVDPATLAVGDVIEFHDPQGRSVIHRIVAIDDGPTGRLFTTKGDNNTKPDPSFAAEVINGKVVFLLPAIGWPAIWVRGG